mmetsp:Transcript_93049/g.300720  ORF Transcript_93049/g.300720 Transcript_93049/m.300720 type:complete len:252 (+) Transcript_93049:327-1082(+)
MSRRHPGAGRRQRWRLGGAAQLWGAYGRRHGRRHVWRHGWRRRTRPGPSRRTDHDRPDAGNREGVVRRQGLRLHRPDRRRQRRLRPQEWLTGRGVLGAWPDGDLRRRVEPPEEQVHGHAVLRSRRASTGRRRRHWGHGRRRRLREGRRRRRHGRRRPILALRRRRLGHAPHGWWPRRPCAATGIDAGAAGAADADGWRHAAADELHLHLRAQVISGGRLDVDSRESYERGIGLREQAHASMVGLVGWALSL